MMVHGRTEKEVQRMLLLMMPLMSEAGDYTDFDIRPTIFFNRRKDIIGPLR